MEKNIKNIIFDMGGVLVGLDAQRCIDAFRQIGCDKIAFYVEEHRTEDLFLDTELGRITPEEFCGEVRRLTGCAATDQQIVWAWNQLLTGIDDKKKQCLLQLARHYRLFLLSNTNIMHWHKCRDCFFPYGGHGADDYFERIFLSYEMHLAKPDTRIFTRALAEAGINAAETLFIDDSLDNCRAAGQVGISTLHEATGTGWMRLCNNASEQ